MDKKILADFKEASRTFIEHPANENCTLNLASISLIRLLCRR